jgi:hypothetical protein
MCEEVLAAKVLPLIASIALATLVSPTSHTLLVFARGGKGGGFASIASLSAIAFCMPNAICASLGYSQLALLDVIGVNCTTITIRISPYRIVCAKIVSFCTLFLFFLLLLGSCLFVRLILCVLCVAGLWRLWCHWAFWSFFLSGHYAMYPHRRWVSKSV